jgi:FkbM family methyltransferase
MNSSVALDDIIRAYRAKTPQGELPSTAFNFPNALAIFPVTEEYFEMITLLTAIDVAQERFTMIELGAGWGRWLITAAAALRLYSSMPFYLVGVEAEPTHFKWMLEKFEENDLDPVKHRLIQAAVSDSEGEAFFFVGNSEKWYGQGMVPDPNAHSGQLQHKGRETMLQRFTRWLGIGDPRAVYTRKVPTIRLTSILNELDSVDLIDADIQAAEAAAFESSPELLAEKVKRVFIATHSTEQETRLRRLFSDLSWQPIFDFPCQATSATPFGSIKFLDGVQAWTNNRLGNDR